MKHQILGLITARGGSKGLPGKHLLDLGGKPLISWTVDAARQATSISRLIVSTDSEEIAQVCENGGCEVPFLRPAHLAEDYSPHVDCVIHALDWLRDNEDYIPDYFMLLQPTSPFRTASHIDEAVELAMGKAASSVISVSPVKNHPFFIQTVNKEGVLKGIIDVPSGYLPRQKIPSYWYCNGAIFLLQVDSFYAHKSFFPTGAYAYQMSATPSIQIDNMIDLNYARGMLSTSGYKLD